MIRAEIRYCPPGGDFPNWTPNNRKRLRANFRMRYSAILAKLQKELAVFPVVGRCVTVHCGVSPNLCHKNGWPMNSAEHPAVSISFRTVITPLLHRVYAFHSDQYDTFAGNLAAIAKTLESLRSATRWGVGKMRQYEGFSWAVDATESAPHDPRRDNPRWDTPPPPPPPKQPPPPPPPPPPPKQPPPKQPPASPRSFESDTQYPKKFTQIATAVAWLTTFIQDHWDDIRQLSGVTSAQRPSSFSHVYVNLDVWINRALRIIHPDLASHYPASATHANWTRIESVRELRKAEQRAEKKSR